MENVLTDVTVCNVVSRSRELLISSFEDALMEKMKQQPFRKQVSTYACYLRGRWIQVKNVFVRLFRSGLLCSSLKRNETSFLVILTRRINIHRTFGNGLYARTYGTQKSSGRSKGNFRITDEGNGRNS